jgi:membrane fusion protein, multidrug efflux system
MAPESHLPQHQTASSPPRASRGLRRFGLIAAVAAVAIVVFGILDRRGHEAEVRRWTQEQAIPTVAVITPRAGAAVQRLVLPGTVQAWYEAPIFARVPGYLKDWKFDYGAHVKKGDVLAEIETPDLDAQLAAAQAKLNSARAVVKVREAEAQFTESTYQRWRDSPKGVVSVQEQQSKEADYNSAKARLSSATAEVAVDQGDVDRLQTMANFKNITVPFDGIVTARTTDVGALINAGGGSGPPMFVVSDIKKLRVYVNVPQSYVPSVRIGARAVISVPEYPTRTFEATVEASAQAVDVNSGTTQMQLALDNAAFELMPGGYANVRMSLQRDGVPLHIPSSALVFNQNGLRVATVGPEDRVLFKTVTIARDLGRNIELASGVSLEDRVINAPPDGIAEGDQVRVVSTKGRPATVSAKQGQKG